MLDRLDFDYIGESEERMQLLGGDQLIINSERMGSRKGMFTNATSFHPPIGEAGISNNSGAAYTFVSVLLIKMPL